MGKRGGKKKANNGKSIASFSSLSIKEQASGKKQSHNAKSILKLNHFQNLAQWASSSLPIECNDEPSMGCLGAFFGRRFAEFGESLGISPGPSLFSCQRCETILQPGINCTIRIEKNRAKTRRRSKTKTATQNNVVYTCHFCSHRNLKRGTSKGYMRELAPPKPSFSKLKSAKSASQTCVEEKSNSSDVETARTADSTNSASQACIVEKSNPSDVNRTAEVPSPAVSNTSISLSVTPSSSLASCGAKLLDSKKRKRKKPEPKKSADEKLVNSAPADKEKTSGASQKRKKSWTTLKEIAESEQHDRNQRFTKFSIPFIL